MFEHNLHLSSFHAHAAVRFIFCPRWRGHDRFLFDSHLVLCISISIYLVRFISIYLVLFDFDLFVFQFIWSSLALAPSEHHAHLVGIGSRRPGPGVQSPGPIAQPRAPLLPDTGRHRPDSPCSRSLLINKIDS